MKTNVQVIIDGNIDLARFLGEQCERVGLRKGKHYLLGSIGYYFGVYIDDSNEVYTDATASSTLGLRSTTISITKFLANLTVQPIEVQLNSDYKAMLTKNGITVGCQKFPLDIIEKLVEAKKKLNE